MSHETLPVRNDRLIEFWVSYRSSLLSSPKVVLLSEDVGVDSSSRGWREDDAGDKLLSFLCVCCWRWWKRGWHGGEVGRERGRWVDRASGEMELCSLNMDVIFRAEQKERRGTSEREERAKADMGCGKNRGSG